MIKYLLILLLVPFWVDAQLQMGQDSGEYPLPEKSICVTPSERAKINSYLKANIEQLKKEGIISTGYRSTSMVTLFDFPLQKNSTLTFNNYFSVSNYVDHDNTTGLEDYLCNERTYDGHNGTDYFTYPFPWFMVENDLVEVIAAADGVIIGKSDNQDDDHCDCFGMWNAVYVQHSDGSIAWYGHLKTNSLTSKNIGESVVSGEYLGVVASSGCSTGPHLHFEVYDAEDNLIHPYEGTCNSLNASTWWNDQPSYEDPQINAVVTHSEPPEFGCPGNFEDPHFEDTFYPGDMIYMATYYRDQQSGVSTTYTIKRPDQTTWQMWNHSSSSSYYASYWYWWWYLPTNGPYGTWTFQAEYDGQIESTSFRYLDPTCSEIFINTYTGPNNGTWNFDASLWSLGFLPSSCDVVQIPAGITLTLEENEIYECYKVELGNNAQIDVSENSQLNINGN